MKPYDMLIFILMSLGVLGTVTGLLIWTQTLNSHPFWLGIIILVLAVIIDSIVEKLQD